MLYKRKIVSIFLILVATSIVGTSIELKASSRINRTVLNVSPDNDSLTTFQGDPAHSGYSSSQVAEANKTPRVTEKNDYSTIKGVANVANLSEILDQSQNDTSRTFGAATILQSFKPTLPVLTKVDFYMLSNTGVMLSIYSSRTTDAGLRPDRQLRSLSILAPGSTPGWVEFVFSYPISLLPEKTYFIMVQAGDVYYWSASANDSYLRGEAVRWDNPNLWEAQPWDFPFRTYGYTPTLTIRTSGVSSHSPVAVTLNAQSAGTVYDSSPLEVSSKNIIWMDGNGTVNVGIDSSRVFSIDPNTRYAFTSWMGPYGNWSNNPFTINLLDENESFTANFKIQYLTNIAFKDNDGGVDLNPTYVKTLAPNRSLATFSSFTNQWIDNGTWALQQVIWEGNNVTPMTNSIYTTIPGGIWNIKCRVFQVNFAESFKDSKGTDLYAKPSSFKLTFPNGTTSASLIPRSYLIQNGTTFWSSIMWQESEVTANTYFDAQDGEPIANCKVYSLAVNPDFYDNTGTMSIQPSSWALRYPNGTDRTLSSPVTYNQTQSGSYSIENVVWKGHAVLRQPVSILIATDTTWNPWIDCILPASISISLSSSTSYIGFRVGIEGNLTYNAVGISAASVFLSYSVTGGASWNDITLVKTAGDGSFSAEWIPTATGNYIVRGQWEGNYTFPATTSILNLAIKLYENQYVFPVESNSTISDLTFNNTSHILSFTASGISGTKGYTRVTIAKSLAPDVSKLTVSIDGIEYDYTVQGLDDSWVLVFTYSHSIHQIDVDLNQSAIPEFPSFLILPLFFIATLIAVIVYRRKHFYSTGR